MDINDIIQDEISQMAVNGDIEKIIREKAQDVIKSSVNDAFRSYGTIGKQIEESVKGALKLDFSKIDLDEYNLIISQMVKRLALEHLEEKAQNQIIKRLDKLLSPAPEEITVQKIVNHCIEKWKEYKSPMSDSCYIEIKHHDWCQSSSSTTIKIWEEEPTGLITSKMNPDIDVHINDKTIIVPRMNNHTFPTKWGFDIDSFIYQMCAAQTVITDAHEVQDYDISTSYFDY